jgi:hypothetical protein
MAKGKAVSRGQALQIAGRVATQIDWDLLDNRLGSDRLQNILDLPPQEFRNRFTTFLLNDAQLIASDRVFIPTIPFDPHQFLCQKYEPRVYRRFEVWRGSLDGFEEGGTEEIDIRSLGITELKLTSIILESCLRKNERYITGEERLRRLKKEKPEMIRLGANAFLGLWLDYLAQGDNSGLEWLYRNRGIEIIDFYGIVLRGRGCDVLYLHRDNFEKKWSWNIYSIRQGFDESKAALYPDLNLKS